MTVRIGDIVIDCQDARLAAVFWCAVLGYRITESDDTGVAVAGDSSSPTLLFLESNDRKAAKNRIHFDVQCRNCRSGIMITGRSGAMDTVTGRAAPEVTVLVDDATDGTFETSFVLPPGYNALQIETYTPDAPGNWVLTIGEPGTPTPATTP